MEWHHTTIIGERRVTVTAPMPRPRTRKADHVEAAVRFLLQHSPPPYDIEIHLLDRESLDFAGGVQAFGCCHAQRVMYIAYRNKPLIVLDILCHEWGHALGYRNETACDVGSALITPVAYMVRNDPGLSDDLAKIVLCLRVSATALASEHTGLYLPATTRELLDQIQRALAGDRDLPNTATAVPPGEGAPLPETQGQSCPEPPQ